MRIGYLEDQQAQAELVISWLEDRGYEVFHAATGAEFLKTLVDNPVDLLVLDWQLPDMEGVDVLRSIRQQLQIDAPVIFATQRDAEADIVRALECGADDYLVKPLRQAELLARLEALARRAGVGVSADFIELGPIVIDTAAEKVTVNNCAVKLTPKDYKLACCLLGNIGKLLSRDYLLREVWGIDAPINTRTVDVHVSRVRRALNLVPEVGYCVKTVYQHGYRLEKVGELKAIPSV
jgi:DNA-binding response OmpR family regulator